MNAQLEQLRSMVRAGRSLQAAREAEELLAGEVDPQEQAHLYHLLGAARYRLGSMWPAIQATRRAEGLASEWGLPDVLGKARINLVAMLADVGDYGLAAETGDRLLASASHLPDDVQAQLCHVHYNLARVYHARREHRMMFEQVDRALKAAEAAEAPASFLVMVHQQAAWWRYLGDQIAQGDKHAEAARGLVSPDDREGAREQLLLTCLRAHQTGDMAKAVTLAEEFLAEGAPSSLLHRMWAAYIAGSAALHLERICESEQLAERALDWAIELGLPEHMKRTNDLRRRVRERRQEAG